mmetsp:Transcript_2806/g.7905  ORF Transcript_2806/g.7905 Transcript_2806/m.7905 type:complete len:417 (-) Transcript_2806:505-1755(-)
MERENDELEGYPQPACCTPASPFRTPRHSRAPSRVTYVNMSSEVFETDIVAATTTHDDAMRAAEEPKKGLWLTRGLLLAGWMCSLLLVVVLAALLFSGKLYGTAATSAGSEEDLRPGGAAPAGRPFSPPTQWPMDAGATCLQGRSQALHGSGQAICHQGAGVPTSDFMDSPLPGDGACAFCMAGARADEPEQCIACHEGFLLHVTNAEKCTGRCVPADQQEPVALPEEVCTAPTDTAACAMHGDPLLCYDNRVTCHYRIEWDDGMCDGRMGKWCQATCQACEGPSPDTHLEGLLLQWKQTLSLGPSSPLRWGWQADIPVNRWPGVLVEEPASGGFLRELCGPTPPLSSCSASGHMSLIRAAVPQPSWHPCICPSPRSTAVGVCSHCACCPFHQTIARTSHLKLSPALCSGQSPGRV